MHLKRIVKSSAAAIICTIFMSLTLSPQGEEKTTVKINITEIRSDKGSILVGVFTDHEGFASEEGVLDIKLSKDKMENGSMSTTIELESGTYGISVLDDENNNGEMDTNFMGIPKEGFGFSDYYHTALRKPVFEDFKFTIKEEDTVRIDIRMNYYL